ncbi:MAG: hypothetical protein WD771_06600 [Gemmatimonadaceae bacterium]
MRTDRVLLMGVCLALLPTAAAAQWGVAGGVRTGSGGDGSDANGVRRGVEGRVFHDRALGADRLAVRAELAYNQMQYDRDDAGTRFQIAENGFELLAAVRADLRGALTGLYLTAGPVASFRAACGTSSIYDSNGRVACAEGDTYLTGYALGAGFTWPAARSDVLFEIRYMGHVTAANGRQLVAIGVGVRQKRKP